MCLCGGYESSLNLAYTVASPVAPWSKTCRRHFLHTVTWAQGILFHRNAPIILILQIEIGDKQPQVVRKVGTRPEWSCSIFKEI